MDLRFVVGTMDHKNLLFFLCLLFIISCSNNETILEGSVSEVPLATAVLSENIPVLPQGTRVTEATLDEVWQSPTVPFPNHISPTVPPVLPTLVSGGGLPVEDTLLNGPLVGFRGFDHQGDILLILDVSQAISRQVRENIDHPFGPIWFGNGCEIYTSQGTVNLQGELVWHKPDLNWQNLLLHEEAYNQIGLISPNRQWLAYDIHYGEQFYDESEFTDLAIVNLVESAANPVFVTTDGRANTFAWSSDSLWLAYKHVGGEGNSQLFRISPNGKEHEQMTFHKDRIGIGYITWSPNGRYIAYAGYQSIDGGHTGTGWVDVIDTETLSLSRIMPTSNDFGGIRENAIWWDVDSTKLMISGRNWQGPPDTTQIYWVDVTDSFITDSYHASEAPTGVIDEVYAIGSLNQVLLSTFEAYYLLDVTDKSYKRMLFDISLAGQRYNSASTPFDFPGEKSCQH